MRSVVEMMAARTIGSMIVVDDEERPVGIFTQSDVLKRIVLPAASPTSRSNGHVAASAYAAVGGDGLRRGVGMANMHGVAMSWRWTRAAPRWFPSAICLAAAARRFAPDPSDRSTRRPTSRCCCRPVADVRQLSLNMLAQGVGAEQITQFISALNDTLTRRVIELNLGATTLSVSIGPGFAFWFGRAR